MFVPHLLCTHAINNIYLFIYLYATKASSSSTANLPKSSFPPTVSNININNASSNKTNDHKQNGRYAGKQITFQPTQVSAAILQAQTANKFREIQELSDSTDNDGWEKPKHRRNRRFVVGDNISTDIQTVPKFISLHVTRLNPETQPDDFQKSLVDKFPGVMCEEHESKLPNVYKSMKVTIRQEHFKNAWRRDVWPSGALVSRFLTKRRIAPQSKELANPSV